MLLPQLARLHVGLLHGRQLGHDARCEEHDYEKCAYRVEHERHRMEIDIKARGEPHVDDAFFLEEYAGIEDHPCGERQKRADRSPRGVNDVRERLAGDSALVAHVFHACSYRHDVEVVVNEDGDAHGDRGEHDGAFAFAVPAHEGRESRRSLHLAEKEYQPSEHAAQEKDVLVVLAAALFKEKRAPRPYEIHAVHDDAGHQRAEYEGFKRLLGLHGECEHRGRGDQREGSVFQFLFSLIAVSAVPAAFW